MNIVETEIDDTTKGQGYIDTGKTVTIDGVEWEKTSTRPFKFCRWRTPKEAWFWL